MTTSGIKGPCSKGCSQPAAVNHHKDGKMTPLCFECFRNGYNEHWRLEPAHTPAKAVNAWPDETLPFETDDAWPEEIQPFQEVRVRCVHGVLFGDSCEFCDAVLGIHI